MLYRVVASSHVTIYCEETNIVAADSPEEARAVGKEAFHAAMEERFPWCDYDEVHIEECVEC